MILFVGLLLGGCAGWKAAVRSYAPPVASVDKTEIQAQQRDKTTQSQTRYTSHNRTPRFVLLSEFEQGCWNG
jgi:hypothetical protein